MAAIRNPVTPENIKIKGRYHPVKNHIKNNTNDMTMLDDIANETRTIIERSHMTVM